MLINFTKLIFSFLNTFSQMNNETIFTLELKFVDKGLVIY